MANFYQRATKGMQNAGRTLAKDYASATKGMQNVGRKIASNVSQGQKDLKSGKVGRYDYINPLKGAGKAFVGSFKKGGKIKKTGLAKVHKGERVLTKKQTKKFDQAKFDRVRKNHFGI